MNSLASTDKISRSAARVPDRACIAAPTNNVAVDALKEASSAAKATDSMPPHVHRRRRRHPRRRVQPRHVATSCLAAPLPRCV